MGKLIVAIVGVGALLVGGLSAVVVADEGLHFHCSVCSSHDHGSMWHDSDKDGTNDR